MLKRTFKITLFLLLMSILFVKPVFAGNTASFAVSCYMPFYTTTSSGEKFMDEDKNASINIPQPKIQKDKTDLIEQKEKIVLEDQEKTQLITTVCAR